MFHNDHDARPAQNHKSLCCDFKRNMSTSLPAAAKPLKGEFDPAVLLKLQWEVWCDLEV